jgi:Fe-S-cluster containining protein
MNLPAIAKQTYDQLKEQTAFSKITDFVVLHLKKIASPIERAKFIHNIVDEYNRPVFSHPLVKELSPCKAGCAGCCHTQVSITEDEADLLASKIEGGVKIDFARLQKQVKAGNESAEFYKLSYNDRRCVFLGAENKCQVYSDRPSVCRTNSVLGEASQCSTENGYNEKQTLRLVKTAEADMAIVGSFMASKSNGALAYMLGKIILNTTPSKSKAKKKSFSNNIEI